MLKWLNYWLSVIFYIFHYDRLLSDQKTVESLQITVESMFMETRRLKEVHRDILIFLKQKGSHAGVAGGEILGETSGYEKAVMTGELLPPPEKAAPETSPDPLDKRQGLKTPQPAIYGGKIFDCSASLLMDAPKNHVAKFKKPIRHGIVGRPEKIGVDVSHATIYRRRKKLKQKKEQGILL
jgi:hypothetical protein